MTMTGEIQGTKKEFIKIFNEMCYSRSGWQVWSDLISTMACSIANAVDRSEPRFSNREKEYAHCIERLGGVDKPAKCFAIVVEALERNPEQDFLGELYMELELGNHWKGQFFTPYCVCKMMSEITVGDVDRQIEEKGYISICDPACGAGATLIAAVNSMRNAKHNFQNHVLFVGQDIDRIVGMMCYIQLSLLGCAGWVAVANTISNPVCGDPLMPVEKPGQEFWYTPFYFRGEWNCRRQIQIFKEMCGSWITPIEERNPGKITFYFDFEKGDYKCQNS